MLFAQPRLLVARRHPPPLDIAQTIPVISDVPSHDVRSAGAAFVRGTTSSWSRSDLANWLVCQYAPCALDPSRDDRGTRPPAAERTRDDGIFARVIVDARDHVLRLLRDLKAPSCASPVARLAIASGMVAPRHDVRDGIVYAPVALTRLCISERAESLFIADYLKPPDDYGRRKVCRECGELSVTGALAHAGWCEATPSQC
jgi:hypothetical protein